MIKNESLVYKPTFNYTFSKGISGAAFALIIIGEINDDPKIYDLGISRLKDTIINLNALNETDLILFANSLLFLQKNNSIESEDDFFERFDLYVNNRIIELDVSFDNLDVFIFLYYCAHRYNYLKSEYLVYQVFVNILCDIIIKVDNIPESKRSEILHSNVKFFYYCELLVLVLANLNFCKKLAARLKDTISTTYKAETKIPYSQHNSFSRLYLETLSENSLSDMIQRDFCDSLSSFQIQREKFVLFNNLEQGILNSDLGLALSKVGRQSPYFIDINFLVQFYSNKNYDISFRATNRVLF